MKLPTKFVRLLPAAIAVANAHGDTTTKLVSTINTIVALNGSLFLYSTIYNFIIISLIALVCKGL